MSITIALFVPPNAGIAGSGDTVTRSSERYETGELVTATIFACRAGSPTRVESWTVEQEGRIIRIRAVIGGLDFAVGSCYEQAIDLGAFPPGDYAVEYYCGDAFAEPAFTDSAAFDVFGSVAVPALNSFSLALLSGALLPIGFFAWDRRRRRRWTTP